MANVKVSANGTDQVVINKCLCGCGGDTKSRFVPGHDSKLKSRFQKAHREGKLSAAEKSLIADLGWEKFLRDGYYGKEVELKSRTGLTIPQITVLKTLAKVKRGLTRAEVKERAKVSESMTSVIGPVYKEDTSKVEERIGRKTLLGLKLVAPAQDTKDGKDVMVYSITAAGRKALEVIKLVS